MVESDKFQCAYLGRRVAQSKANFHEAINFPSRIHPSIPGGGNPFGVIFARAAHCLCWYYF